MGAGKRRWLLSYKTRFSSLAEYQVKNHRFDYQLATKGKIVTLQGRNLALPSRKISPVIRHPNSMKPFIRFTEDATFLWSPYPKRKPQANYKKLWQRCKRRASDKQLTGIPQQPERWGSPRTCWRLETKVPCQVRLMIKVY